MSEAFDVNVPAAPREGSVVLDAEGRAWQRDGCDGGTWKPCRYVRHEAGLIYERGMPWGHLLVDYGPLELLFEPDEKGTES